MLKFLTNTHDPQDELAYYFVVCNSQETREEAWIDHLEWLKDKIIGDPQPTEYYTVDQIKEEKLVGVYIEIGNTDNVKQEQKNET